MYALPYISEKYVFPRLCRFSRASAWASNTALGKLALVKSMMIYMRIEVMMMIMIMALILVSLKEICTDNDDIPRPCRQHPQVDNCAT